MLDALVISDLHYIGRAGRVCPIAARKTGLGPALVRAALRCLRGQGVQLDLVILLGDLVDDGLAPGAGEDLAAVAAAARAGDVPLLAVPGNHDGDQARFVDLFDCRPGLHQVGGYGFLVFHDHVGQGKVTTRPPEDLDLPAGAAPLVALQHNPVLLEGRHDYPYLLANAGAVLRSYREAGVILSLSGHYHPGQPLRPAAGGVPCYTAPAACEVPFRCAHLHLAGRQATLHEIALTHT